MPAEKWLAHDQAIEDIIDGDLDVVNDTFVIRLYSSASNVGGVALDDASAATNELPSANGYLNGGQAVTVSKSRAGGTTTIHCTNPTWLAAGGSIAGRFAALVNTTRNPNQVVASCLMDDTPADVSAPDGENFRITIAPTGLFSFSRKP